jgi:hypothetical protein
MAIGHKHKEKTPNTTNHITQPEAVPVAIDFMMALLAHVPRQLGFTVCAEAVLGH